MSQSKGQAPAKIEESAQHSENCSQNQEHPAEFAKRRPFAMHRVKSAGFLLGQAHGFDGHDCETRLVDAAENLALQPAADGVRLDNCKCAFESQADPPEILRLSIGNSALFQDFNAAATDEPRSAGVSTQRMPAALIAAYLSFAVPCPP